MCNGSSVGGPSSEEVASSNLGRVSTTFVSKALKTFWTPRKKSVQVGLAVACWSIFVWKASQSCKNFAWGLSANDSGKRLSSWSILSFLRNSSPCNFGSLWPVNSLLLGDKLYLSRIMPAKPSLSASVSFSTPRRFLLRWLQGGLEKQPFALSRTCLGVNSISFLEGPGRRVT